MDRRHRIHIQISRDGTTQDTLDAANARAAAMQVRIPARMMDSLARAAATVEDSHRMHDVVSRIRAQEQFGPMPQVPLRLILSREMTVVASEPQEALVFDTVRVGHGKVLAREDKCAICLCKYEPSDKGNILPCQHGFHEACLKEWTNDHDTCPTCRFCLR